CDNHRQPCHRGSAAFASIVDSPGYNHIQNEGSGKCIDAGDYVQQWRCLNTSFEEWSVPGGSSGHIENNAYRQCLTQADSLVNGTAVVLEPCTGDQKQLWNRNELGTDNHHEIVQFQNRWSEQCLDVENGDTSTAGYYFTLMS